MKLCILASALLLAACGRPGQPGQVTLRFWAMGAEGEVVQRLMPEFERENPGIRVRVQRIPWTAAHEKLLTAHVGEATPDVAQLGNTWVPEFVALDALRPLDDLVASSTRLKAEDFFSGIWDTNVLGGVAYGIPWYVDTRVLFYRKDILARAGYDSIPETWAGWLAAMEAVKRHVGDGRYAILLPTNEWAQPVILGQQAGSPLLRDGGRYGAFEGPAFRRAFDFYVGLFRRGLAPKVANTEVANVFQEFARGRFAMYITGPWNVAEFRRRLPPELRDAWTTAPLPGPDGPGLSTAGGSSLVIFRRSEHPAEAWKLVEYLSRPEVQLRFSRLSGDLPARRESWQDTTLLGDPRMHAFWEQLQRVAPLPKVPEIEAIVNMVSDAVEDAVRGGVPADQALAQLDERVNEVLEKRRWMLAHHRTIPGTMSAPAPGGSR